MSVLIEHNLQMKVRKYSAQFVGEIKAFLVESSINPTGSFFSRAKRSKSTSSTPGGGIQISEDSARRKRKSTQASPRSRAQQIVDEDDTFQNHSYKSNVSSNVGTTIASSSKKRRNLSMVHTPSHMSGIGSHEESLQRDRIKSSANRKQVKVDKWVRKTTAQTTPSQKKSTRSISQVHSATSQAIRPLVPRVQMMSAPSSTDSSRPRL
jgi:hypothetical protein